MTEEQRQLARDIIKLLATGHLITTHISDRATKAVILYLAEHERMREFIRNLADEARVYLESEDD